MGQLSFSNEEDDGSFAKAIEQQSQFIQEDDAEAPVAQQNNQFSNEDDGSFVMPEEDDFESAEVTVPEDQERPVVEVVGGQKNDTHLRDDIEEEQSDRSIGRVYDDVTGFGIL